jgi:uncharacterized protein (TIGR02996 family)
MSDPVALAAALERGELDAVSQALGVTIDARAAAKLVELGSQEAIYRVVDLGRILAYIAEAARSPGGIVYDRVSGSKVVHVLLVRFSEGGGERLAIGVSPRTRSGIGLVWPELAGWARKMENNRARAERWARARGRLTLPVTGRVVEGSEANLLAAIVAAPDDDEPRLVYADWLIERGEPHGELIRLECELARTDERSARALELHQIIEPMLKTSWRLFAGELAPWASERSFHRGFVDEVSMSLGTFAKHGEALFSRHPIRGLTVTPRPNVGKLARAPGLRLVEELWLPDPKGELAALATARLGRLKMLTLHHAVQPEADLAALFARIDAPALASLHLDGCAVGASVYRAFARLERLRCLRVVNPSSLVARDWRVTDALAALATARPLDELGLFGHRALLDAAVVPFLSSLRALEIVDAPITDTTARAIARAPALERLVLLGTQIMSDGAVALLGAPRLRQLELGQYTWSFEGRFRFLRALLALPTDHPLRIVELSGFADSDEKLAVQRRFHG